MSAASAIMAARNAGIAIISDGKDLVLEGTVAPPQKIIDDLLCHKKEILALVTPARLHGWTALDWHAFFEERAAIAEFDGGMCRPEAEARAYECCVVEYMNQTHVGSAPGFCAHCGQGEHPHTPVLPFGTSSTSHAWLHSHCWSDWQKGRSAAARETLAAMGLSLEHLAAERGAPAFGKS